MSEGLLTQFCEWVENAIDERGIYPAPAFWINRKGESTLAALALDGEGVLTEVWRQISCEQVTELVFGLDRSTRQARGLNSPTSSRAPIGSRTPPNPGVHPGGRS